MKRFRMSLFVLLSVALTAGTLSNRAAAGPVTLVMFHDGEVGGWFSHQGSIPTVTAPVHTSSRAMALTLPADTGYPAYNLTMGWDGTFTDRPFRSLVFYVHGGAAGGQTFQIKGLLPAGTAGAVTVPDAAGRYLDGGLKALPPNRWVKATVPLADLGVAGRDDFRGVAFENPTKTAQATFYVDDMALVGDAPTRAAVTVDAAKTVRVVNDHVFGINTYGVARADDPLAVDAARDARYRFQRAFYPTFNVPNGLARGLPFAEATGADMMGAVNWADQGEPGVTPLPGDVRTFGTPEQAAAMVAWANVPADAPAATLDLSLGKDAYGRDWGTVRRWVNVRASEAPLATDDGFNVMRLKRARPFFVRFWELDNEPWMHAKDSDWKKYADWYKRADALMKKVYPACPIQTGLSLIGGDDNPGLVPHEVSDPTSGQKHRGFNWVVLFYLSGQDEAASPGRVVPDFIVTHTYAGTLSGASADLATLLTYEQVTGANWNSLARDNRFFLTEFYNTHGRTDGNRPPFIVTENNDASTFPLARITTSLVGGLYAADDLGQILQSRPGDFEGLTWHDWDDGDLTKGGFLENPAMYGWRPEAGYGVYRDGARTKYPVHYAFKMLSRFFAHGGDTVVPAASDTLLLQPFAVRQKNGNLALLLINKSADTDIAASLSLRGYAPGVRATAYRYGKAEDANEADISAAPITFDPRRPLTLPAYSMTVLTLTRDVGVSKPSAPTAVTALAGDACVRLTWTAMSGATTYDLRRRVGGAAFVVKGGLTATTYTDTDLANGTAYRYIVTARGAGGASAPSDPSSATPAAPPGPVSGLAAVAADGQAALTWAPTPGAADYVVRRALRASGPFTTVSTHPYRRNADQSLMFTAYTDHGLAGGQTYTYEVAAVSVGGEGRPARVSATAGPTRIGLWKSADVGGSVVGSTRFDAASGRFTLSGAGEAWYGQGKGRFVYQTLRGDGSITARVVSGENGRYEKNVYGVMLRQSLDPNESGRFALCALTPVVPPGRYGAGATNGPAFLSYGDGTHGVLHFDSDTQPDNAKRPVPPYWVRLTRAGDTVTGAVSPDGAAWMTVGTDTLAGWPRDLDVGLIADSMVYFAPSAGVFDHVTLTGGGF